MKPFTRTIRKLGLVIFVLVLALPSAAHEIPHDVSILAHVRQTGDVVDVLVRVPLEAMRDIDLPMRGPGYLIFGDALNESLRDAAEIWIAGGLSVYANDFPLAAPDIVSVRISLPSDRSFDGVTSALAHLEREAVATSDLLWNQALFDLRLRYTDVVADASIALKPAWAHLGVRTTTRVSVTLPDGSIRRVRFVGDPGLVTADPGVGAVAGTFFELGMRGFVERWETLLFVLCLLIVVRGRSTLTTTTAALLAGFSVSLLGLAAGVDIGPLWFGMLIAGVSAIAIFCICVMNLVEVWRGRTNTAPTRRLKVGYAVAVLIGYLAADTLLTEMSFAGSLPIIAALGYLAGFGVALALATALIGAVSVGIRARQPHQIVATVASVLIAHTAWHWTLERFAVLAATHLVLPPLMMLLEWATLVLVAIGVYVGLVAFVFEGGAFSSRGSAPRAPRRIGAEDGED